MRVSGREYDQLGLELLDALAQDLQIGDPVAPRLLGREVGEVREEGIIEPREHAASGFHGELRLGRQHCAVGPAEPAELRAHAPERREARVAGADPDVAVYGEV